MQTEKETRVEEGRVVLFCREEYPVEEEERDSDRDTRTTTHWKRDETKVASNKFLNQTTLAAGAAQSFEFAEKLTPNALETWEGGQLLRYPFKPTLPSLQPCTGTTHPGEVSWKLSASLARGFLWGSYDVETEIFASAKRAR